MPMSFETWLSFFALCWGMSLSPGPAQVASLTAAINYGWKRAIAQTFGLASGVFALIIIVGLGIGALLAASPALFGFIRFCGCAYLVWLGVCLLRSKAQAVVIDGTGSALQSISLLRLWWRGFLINATNPKGLIFFLSLLTPFLDTSKAILPQYIQMGFTCGFTDLCVMTGVTLIAEALSKKLRNSRNNLIMNRIFGSVFVTIGLALMLFNA